MKNIARFSVNYPVTVAMIVLGILLLGGISFSRLGTDLFPDLNNPSIVVELRSGERPPEEVEKRYAEPIEAMVIRQQGVVKVSSVCRVGVTLVTVEYLWDQDMDEAFLDLQKALSSFDQDEEVEELNIFRNNPNASPVMVAAISHPTIKDMDELRRVAQNYVRNELIRLEGIADVQLSGEEYREVIIETDPFLLESHGLSASQIVSKIKSLNRNVSGGSIEESGQKYIIKGVGVLTSVEEVGRLIIGRSLKRSEDGSIGEIPLKLEDVATVRYANQDPKSINHLNGQRCIGLSIYKETSYNTLKAIETLNEGLREVRKALPGYEISIVKNQGTFISGAVNEVEESALVGIVFAVLVLFVFLRRVGTTFIVSVAIPISVVATFNLMYFNGLTINIMTLGGLALGAGMLVDNAIVVMENIFRNLEEGKSIKAAAIDGTTGVAGALVASTLTTIVVFLPIVYLHGASGELFKDQAWTVAFSLLSSLVVALLVIPVLSVKFIKPHSAKGEVIKGVHFPRYERFLRNVLVKRKVVVLVALGVCVIAWLLLKQIGSEFMPQAETREFSMEVTLPQGTSLARTASTIQGMEQVVMEVLGEGVDFIYSHAGPQANSESGESDVLKDENTGYLKLVFNEDNDIKSSEVIPVLGELFKDIPGVDIQFVEDETALKEIMGTDEAPFVVEVEGDDLTVLEQISHQIDSVLKQQSGLYNVNNSFSGGAPEVDVVVDRYRAGLFNLSVQTIVSQLKDYLMGQEAGDLETGGELTDITIKMPRFSLKALGQFKIQEGSKEYFLSEVAKVSIETAPKEILRTNQKRVGKVDAHVSQDVSLDKLVSQVRKELTKLELPDGYRVAIRGDELKREEAFGSLTFALILSIVLVYMVLASQFESLVHPFTILLTIPLAGVGSVFAFFFLGQSLNIMAFIGLVMLAGIAVNDSIILVDAINQLKKGGLDLKEAIVGAALQRIRPIVMTSLTTILALLPLAVGIGESASLRSPMAIAVIGGLVTSTLLTLMVIPCFYYMIDKLVNSKVKEKSLEV